MGFGFGVSCFWQLSFANLNQAWFQILLSVGRMPIQKGEMALFSPVAVPLLSWGGSRPSPACPVLPWRPVFTFPSRCSMRGTSRVLPASPLICQNDWISDCYSVKFGFFFFFWPCPAACGILVPQPGIKPTPPALEAWVLTTGPPGKSPLKFVVQTFSWLQHRWMILCFSLGG